MINDACVLLLVKYPEKEKVKVRLIQHIEEDTVLGLYKNFVLDTLSMLDRSRIPFIVHFYPEDALERFEMWLGAQYQYIPQRGRNIGERLRRGFVETFNKGFRSVMAMATDVPDLPEGILFEARAALEDHDAVIGPSPDGGYYLIGFQRTAFLPEAFEGISWSTDTVFRETVERLKGAGCKIHILPPWGDVDTFEDLKGLVKKNRRSKFSSSRTMKYLLQHREILRTETAC